ncbi:hypothetical protein WISP_42108 [Willisornis vidua]|uniref:Uncharacterized protein n=1 Tax=Willisornis vidua TaxID=1566151 RepID=A0ABQ9DKR0_9PASS|nr:hypothetical protein WISP_42108 [Willisornis vidua]
MGAPSATGAVAWAKRAPGTVARLASMELLMISPMAPVKTGQMHPTPDQSIQEDDTCSCRFPEEEQGEYQDRGKSTEFRDLLVN